MIRLSRCSFTTIATGDKWRTGGRMIAVTLGLTLLYFALLSMFGEHMMVQALLYAAFPIAYTVSTRSTYLNPYSRIARNVIVIVSALAWYAFFLAIIALSMLI